MILFFFTNSRERAYASTVTYWNKSSSVPLFFFFYFFFFLAANQPKFIIRNNLCRCRPPTEYLINLE